MVRQSRLRDIQFLQQPACTFFSALQHLNDQDAVFIPKGFAHGFLVLSDEAEFVYKVDDFYHPNDEGGLMWNDPDIGVNWPIPDGDFEVKLSDKDKLHPPFKK